MTTTDELVKEAINHARENPNLLKTYIFFEATSESIQNYPKCRPIQEACYQNYKKMCEKYGDDAMDYQEFEFWFMRFSRGEFDMDYDRSLAPKNRSFTDLPIDILDLIAEHLDMFDRLLLRRVSKPLQEFIEKQVFHCTSIDVTLGEEIILVSYGNEEILYAKNDKAVKTYEKEYEVCKALVIYEDDSEVCDDLACVLKNPKLQLCDFGLFPMNTFYKAEVLSTFFTKFEYVLKSLKHQIAVRELELSLERPDNLLAILPYLKPRYLEKITFEENIGSFDWKSGENARKLEQIVRLDQWKQTEELHLRYSLDLFPDEVLAQFKRYEIHTETLNRSQLDRIKTMFASSAVFENCFVFGGEISIDFIGVPGPITGGYRSVRHLMIPNTDKLLVFKEHPDGNIDIEKQTRNMQ